MTASELPRILRFAAPQALTGARILLAIGAILLASRQRVDVAAEILLLGLVTDALDGACARKLGVATEFGKLFDFFADYLYFVVAPAMMSLFVIEVAGPAAVFAAGVPCVSAAARYARKAGISETECPGVPGSPGVPTIAYAFFVIALALLRRDMVIGPEALRITVLAVSPVLGVLMTVRTRYPKLSVYPWILVPILAGLMVMPFVLTTVLSGITLALIAVYVVAGPLVVEQPSWRRARSAVAASPTRDE